MVTEAMQNTRLDTFSLGNSLLLNPSSSKIGDSFKEVLDEKVIEVARAVKDKAEAVSEDSNKTKKKKENKNEELINITKFIQNSDRRSSQEVQSVYSLLEKFKEDKKPQDDLLFKGPRQQLLSNANNPLGQPLIQPVYDQGQRRMTRSQLLALWENFAPFITEDVTKKSVRIDIPLLNDVQALVLRIHPDKSITASLLGSKAMGELIKQNKDQLNRNLKHHNLSLREFNTYRSELTFNNEAGTRKKKKQAKPQNVKKVDLDIV